MIGWCCHLLLFLLLAIPTPTCAATCDTAGCTYQSLGCTLNHATTLHCMGQQITGHLHITNLPPTLETIYLNVNRITSIQDDQFQHIYPLKRLYLSDNQLTSLSISTFKHNRELIILSLSNNQLIHLVENTFQHNVELLNLDLSHNRLGSNRKNTNVVEPGIHANQFVWNTKLQVLDLFANQLATVSNHQFATLTALATLRMNDNQLNHLDAHLFVNNALLKEINVLNNPLDFVLAGCELPSRTVLNCSHGRLKTTPQLSRFANVPSATIATIDLSANALQSIDSTFFQDYVQLTQVNVSHNQLAAPLAYGLFKNNPMLTDIDFQGNENLHFVQMNCTMESSSTLNCAHQHIRGQLLAFQHVPNVHTIDLSGNFIEAVALNCFSRLVDLKELNLANNQIVELDGEAFDGNALLNNITLSGNPIGNDGFVCGGDWDYRRKIEYNGGGVGVGELFYYSCEKYAEL